MIIFCKLFRYWLIPCILVLFLPCPALPQTRGGVFSEAVQSAVSGFDYHALVIGINTYDNGIPHLATSVNDAKAVCYELTEKYGFPPGNIVALMDKEATRGRLIATFRELAISLNENDALIIYYAGHGIEDPATGVGYWIPVDAKPNQYDTYIANSDIRNYLRAIKARHIFLVSDSCFSGTLLAQRSIRSEIDERFYAQKAQKRSRLVLTSGGNEPVMDVGRSGHSVFGYFFLQSLRDYDKPYLIPTQIFAEVGPLVGNNSPQTPQCGSMREAMDEGGEIVLVNQRYKAPAVLSFICDKPAKVYLNSKYIGQTPIGAYQVSPGVHSYKMACTECGMDKTGSVMIAAGETKQVQENFVSPVVDNPKGSGYLTIATDPWVRVEIDGKDYGITPLARVELPSGKHSLHLIHIQMGIDKSFQILIEPGKHVKIGPQIPNIYK